MRGRTVLFVVLALATAMVAAYLGWSTSSPKAAGEPSPTAPSAPSQAATHRKASGSAPARPPAPTLPKASATKASSPKGPGSKPAAPKTSAHKSSPQACVPVDAKPAAYVTSTDDQPGTDPAWQALADDGEVHFGPMQEGRHGAVDTSIADDRQALTTTYDDLEVEVANGKVTDCDVTRSYPMTVPLVGSGHRSMLQLAVQGFAFVEKGVTARLTVRGNGRTTTRDFPVGTNDTFDEVVRLPAIPGTTYRLETVVELHQDPATFGTAGILNVVSIDAAIV
jgi:hypothetical protein